MHASSAPFRLTAAQVDAFHLASLDANPLHRDAAYARRSQFGRPVAYGMAAVVAALARWSSGAPFALASLRCEFRKPLFAGQDYEFESAEVRGRTRLRIGRGPVDYGVISFTTAPLPPSGEAPANSRDLAFKPRERAAEMPNTARMEYAYAVDPAALRTLQASLGMPAHSMPDAQFTALLWMSYHVGMEMPGQQALFAEATAEFEGTGSGRPALQVMVAEARFDERFNRYSVDAVSTGLARMRLTAFRRPAPVDVALAGLPALRPEERPLHGKTVLVTGAARGFGAAMARMCARAGARILIHHRGRATDIQPLLEELATAGPQPLAFQADLEDVQDTHRLASELRASVGSIDLLVNNASPPIEELQFLEQDNAAVSTFVLRNISMTLGAVRHLLPLLGAGGQCVLVSSTYMSTPPRGFTHYLAAKGAQEGLMHALAAEYRDIEFVVARLPRMLTDQTNVPFSTSPTASPGEVALALVSRLPEKGPGNYRLLEIPAKPAGAA